MKLKEKLAYDYSVNVNSFAHIPKQIVRQEAFLAGFEMAKKMALMEKHGYEGPFISGTCIEELGEEEV